MDPGQRVRESLQTENRKLAEELRLRREVEVGQRRLGLAAAPAAAVVAAPVVAPGPVPVVAVPVVAAPVAAVAVPGLDEIRAEYACWSVAHKRPKTILNDKARLAEWSWRWFDGGGDQWWS